MESIPPKDLRSSHWGVGNLGSGSDYDASISYFGSFKPITSPTGVSFTCRTKRLRFGFCRGTSEVPFLDERGVKVRLPERKFSVASHATFHVAVTSQEWLVRWPSM